jgi:hypothetical protein
MAFDKVTSGDPLRIPALDYNAMIEAARAEALRQMGTGADAAAAPVRTGEQAWIRNDSGAAREQFDVLALDGVLVTPTQNLNAFKYDPAWKGKMPALEEVGKFAVLLEPAGEGKIVRALLHGVVVCRVNIIHEKHWRADVADGTARLTSNWYGGAEILWKESGTGDKWAVVRLGSFFSGPFKGVSAVNIPVGGSGTVTVWYGGVAMSGSGSTVTAWLNWMATSQLPANKQCAMYYQNDEQRVVAYFGEC